MLTLTLPVVGGRVIYSARLHSGSTRGYGHLVGPRVVMYLLAHHYALRE
jgi:hypothetical protein